MTFPEADNGRGPGGGGGGEVQFPRGHAPRRPEEGLAGGGGLGWGQGVNG